MVEGIYISMPPMYLPVTPVNEHPPPMHPNQSINHMGEKNPPTSPSISTHPQQPEQRLRTHYVTLPRNHQHQLTPKPNPPPSLPSVLDCPLTSHAERSAVSTLHAPHRPSREETKLQKRERTKRVSYPPSHGNCTRLVLCMDSVLG